MDTVIQDIRYGFRAITRQPMFTGIAILALALGIGANTAIFSVINAVLLRPLPFANPDQLVMVYNTTDQEEQNSVTYPDFMDWRMRQTTCKQLAAYSSRDFTLTGTGDPVRFRGLMATAELFPLLAVPPKIGRFFLPEEDRPGARAVILSHQMWQQHFAADPQVLDQTIILNSQPYRVVGVMPAGFAFPIQNDPPIELWTTTSTLQEGQVPLTAQRGNHALEVLGRLQEGVNVAQAQAEMAGIAGHLASQYPDTNSEFGVRVALLQKELVKDIRAALWILFGAVACVLLIACANVANLLLAKATSRQKEIAIRTALGASRRRIIRQLLTESLMLALFGGVFGLFLALWGTDLLVALMPKGLPVIGEIGLDAGVLAFTLLLCLATGILFGLAPALQATRTELTETLKEGGRSSGDSANRNRVRSALVVAEVALALMMLVGAGLLLNSFYRLLQVRPGFEPANVLSFRLSLPDSRYRQPQQITDFFKQLAARLETLPGVKDVAYTTALPFSGQRGGVGFAIEGEPSLSDRPFPYDTNYRVISSGYFRTLGIQLMQGRDFDERDTMQSTPVVVINEVLAKNISPIKIP